MSDRTTTPTMAGDVKPLTKEERDERTLSHNWQPGGGYKRDLLERYEATVSELEAERDEARALADKRDDALVHAEAQNERLREALTPFADECSRWDGLDYKPNEDDTSTVPIDTRISDLARARAALTSYYRGHLIVEQGGDWVYADTRQPVHLNPNRPCGSCGLANTAEGHDGCLGTLPGVTNACCGHGRQQEAYVVFDDGRRISGEDARNHQQQQDDEPNLNKCPGCGGPADNGHDRCVPPSPYFCTKCEPAAPEPPSVAGDRYSCAIVPEEFERRARVQIGIEQEKLSPDTALIARLVRPSPGIEQVKAIGVLSGSDALGTHEEVLERMERRRCCETCEGKGYTLARTVEQVFGELVHRPEVVAATRQGQDAIGRGDVVSGAEVAALLDGEDSAAYMVGFALDRETGEQWRDCEEIVDDDRDSAMKRLWERYAQRDETK